MGIFLNFWAILLSFQPGLSPGNRFFSGWQNIPLKRLEGTLVAIVSCVPGEKALEE